MVTEIDPLDFAASLEERSVETGQDNGHRYGFQHGFSRGFSRGLDYALENHREIALIAAYCEHVLMSMNANDIRQKRLLNAVLESCREFRALIPDEPRYAELQTSIRARYQHLTGISKNNPDKATFSF